MLTFVNSTKTTSTENSKKQTIYARKKIKLNIGKFTASK